MGLYLGHVFSRVKTSVVLNDIVYLIRVNWSSVSMTNKFIYQYLFAIWNMDVHVLELAIKLSLEKGLYILQLLPFII